MGIVLRVVCLVVWCDGVWFSLVLGLIWFGFWYLVLVTWFGIQKQSVSIAKMPIALGREGTQKVTVTFAWNCLDIGLYYVAYIYIYLYIYIYINTYIF